MWYILYKIFVFEAFILMFFLLMFLGHLNKVDRISPWIIILLYEPQLSSNILKFGNVIHYGFTVLCVDILIMK